MAGTPTSLTDRPPADLSSPTMHMDSSALRYPLHIIAEWSHNLSGWDRFGQGTLQVFEAEVLTSYGLLVPWPCPHLNTPLLPCPAITTQGLRSSHLVFQGAKLFSNSSLCQIVGKGNSLWPD